MRTTNSNEILITVEMSGAESKTITVEEWTTVEQALSIAGFASNWNVRFNGANVQLTDRFEMSDTNGHLVVVPVIKQW